jgi:calcineurin-like phosphoesterase family protein
MFSKEKTLDKINNIFLNYTIGNIDGKPVLLPKGKLGSDSSDLKLDPVNKFEDAITITKDFGATIRVMDTGTYLVLNGKFILFDNNTKPIHICALIIDGLSLVHGQLRKDMKQLLGEKYPVIYDPYSDRETTKEILFSADWHIGHHKVSEARGFSHTEAHDVRVITTSLYRVSKGSTVIVVGDLLFGDVANFDKALEQAVKDLFPRWEVGTKLPFNLRIVLGNHDKIIKLLTSKYIGIECIFAMREVKTKEGRIIISHIPVRESEFKPEGRFVGNIHGHLHAKKIGGKYYCVSWEQKRGSYTLSELLEKE